MNLGRAFGADLAAHTQHVWGFDFWLLNGNFSCAETGAPWWKKIRMWRKSRITWVAIENNKSVCSLYRNIFSCCNEFHKYFEKGMKTIACSHICDRLFIVPFFLKVYITVFAALYLDTFFFFVSFCILFVVHLYIFFWSVFSPKLRRSLNATMLHLVCPWALKQIHHLPASICMFDYCNLQLQSPYFVWTTLHASSHCIPGSANKSSGFPPGFKFKFGAAQSMQGNLHDTGEGWVHSVRVVLNRISLSTVANQLLKHVKTPSERSQQWCGSRCCGKQVVALCVHSGHEVNMVGSSCHATEVMSICCNKSVSYRLTLSNIIKLTSICGRAGHPWDLQKGAV